MNNPSLGRRHFTITAKSLGRKEARRALSALLGFSCFTFALDSFDTSLADSLGEILPGKGPIRDNDRDNDWGPRDIGVRGVPGLERFRGLLMEAEDKYAEFLKRHDDGSKDSIFYSEVVMYRHVLFVIVRNEKKAGVIPNETLAKYQQLVEESEKRYPTKAGTKFMYP